MVDIRTGLITILNRDSCDKVLRIYIPISSKQQLSARVFTINVWLSELEPAKTMADNNRAAQQSEHRNGKIEGEEEEKLPYSIFNALVSKMSYSHDNRKNKNSTNATRRHIQIQNKMNVQWTTA